MKEDTKKLNRIKTVLAETGHTGKWLTEQLGKDQATVSKWCTSTSQPDWTTLSDVSNVFAEKLRDLVASNR